MPAAKSPKKKAASPTRSTSRSRKTTKRVSKSRSRSRTRSASRTSTKDSKPVTPTRRSPARKSAVTPPVEQVKEVVSTTIRTSRRLQEKAIQQVNERCAPGEYPLISLTPTPVTEAPSSQHLQAKPSLSEASLSSYHSYSLNSLSEYSLTRDISIQDNSLTDHQLGESQCRSLTDFSEYQAGKNCINNNAHKRVISVSITEARSPSKTEEARSSTGSHAPAFGGDLGGAFLSVALPLLVFYFTFCTTEKREWSLRKIPKFSSKLSDFFDAKVFAVVLGWYAFQLVLAIIPVGPIVAGQPLKNRQRLMYRCNGWLAFYVTTLVFYLIFHYGYSMEYVESHWLHIVTAGVVYSCIVAMFMYVRGRNAPKADLAPEATGSFFNDFWMGRELNPRFMDTYFDYKFFFELRVGLLGWMIINWCLVVSQYEKNSTVTPALAMVTIFQTLYVFDALRNESAILTTLDITTEGFGFMLSFGDLAWVPYLYTLQARFIYKFPEKAVTNYYALAAICVLEVAGLILFRGANAQKNEFRKNPYNPELAHLTSIPTAQGKRLLCSGFWGICRRPNYLGDILMAMAWSLPCGCSNLIPYFYPMSFIILLVHRCVRDEAYCRQRYGAAWDKYCAAVPYRIIPYVF